MTDETIKVVIRAQIGQLQQDMNDAKSSLAAGMDAIRNAINAQRYRSRALSQASRPESVTKRP